MKAVHVCSVPMALHLSRAKLIAALMFLRGPILRPLYSGLGLCAEPIYYSPCGLLCSTTLASLLFFKFQVCSCLRALAWLFPLLGLHCHLQDKFDLPQAFSGDIFPIRPILTALFKIIIPPQNFQSFISCLTSFCSIDNL